MSLPERRMVNVVPSKVLFPRAPTAPISAAFQAGGSETDGPLTILNRSETSKYNRVPDALNASICSRAVFVTGPGEDHVHWVAVIGRPVQPAIAVNVWPSLDEESRRRELALVNSVADQCT